MRKLYSVTNFSEGINSYSPQGASNIENFQVTHEGALETRRGWTVNDSFSLSSVSDTGSPLQIFFANGKLFLQSNNGLYTLGSNTLTTVNNYTGASGGKFTNFFTSKLDVTVADNNRVFLASSNANLWLDTSELTPALYNWGVSAAQLSVALTDSPVTFGGVVGTHATSNGMHIQPANSSYGELKPGWYAFAMAYELRHGGTSPLSRRKLVYLDSSNNAFHLILPHTGDSYTTAWTSFTGTKTLNGTIDDSTTSVVVSSAEKLLVGMDITIDSEMMTISNISGTTLTVARAQHGTTAASHTNGVNVTFNLLDRQVTGIKVYATDKTSEVTFDEAEGAEKQLAMTSPLKYIRTVTLTEDASAQHIYYQALGVKSLAGQIEGASVPPDGLNNISLYGGRIWGSVSADSSGDSTDKLGFSALDETAAPLYDIFPMDEISESSRTYAPIPHVVNVRDRVTGIGASRDYLAVFSENSIQMVKGQGIISGIYGKTQPGTDLDVSDYLTLMGAKNRHCIAESLGNVYFYSSHDKRVYRIDREGQVTWISQAVQDLINTLETPINSVIQQLVAHEGSVFLVRRSGQNVVLLEYDGLRNQWTSHDFGSSASMTSFVSLPREASGFDLGLYALRDVNNQVAKIFPDSGAGSTNDNGSAIVPSYTSQEFAFTKPTRLDAVRIGTEQELTSNVTLNIYVDGSLSRVMTTGKLTKETDFTIRTFERGYKHKVAFFLSGAQTVRFFELQFRSR